MAMQIILIKDVDNLGHVGQVVSVKPGYGRNYLVPQGFALLATKENLALMGARKRVFEAAATKVRGEAEQVAARIEQISGKIRRKVGEHQMLYGSVTTGDVAEALKSGGVTLDKRRVVLGEPIKKLGDYSIAIRLHADVTAHFKVSVVSDQE